MLAMAHTRTYLKALNKGDRKKFKNMDITGVIHVQCPHVFIQASVDLQLGERFGNSDYALAHAIRQYPSGADSQANGEWITTCNDFTSYDIACAYSTNIEQRFDTSFPDLVPAISRMRWLIPLVHVQNHEDGCIYLYACSYNKHAGHQHGETCEVYWVESNQLGGQVRQMNNGHRHDTLIDNHSDWNWRKTASMADTLFMELSEAQELFRQHFEEFKSLCRLYANFIPEWEKMRDQFRRDSSPAGPTRGRKTDVQSVYRHNVKAVPSQAKAFQYLKTLTDDRPRSTRANGASVSDHAFFINEGIEIEVLQRKLLARIAALNRDQSDSGLKKEILDRRPKLRKRIDEWRNQQKTMTPALGDHVLHQRASRSPSDPDSPELEKLYLPSHFSLKDRLRLGLVELADTERQLREGTIFDSLRDIQSVVKALGVLYGRKPKEAYGQALNTRANMKIFQTQAELDLLISHYNASRDAYLTLDATGSKANIFKPLTVHDTYRKSTYQKRKIGDSRKFDGLAYRIGVSSFNNTPGALYEHVDNTTLVHDEVIVATQGTKAKKRRVTHRKDPAVKKGTKRKVGRGTQEGESSQAGGISDKAEDLPREDGWIWRLESMTGMKSREIEEWAKEGNRVQWFRAEAEMERWQEQLEIKQAELKRTIATFDTMSSVWNQLATSSERPGHAAYARKKAEMYMRMALHARRRATESGYGERLIPERSLKPMLAAYILADHAQTDAELNSIRSDSSAEFGSDSSASSGCDQV
ncbi:hypothetical protein FPV67DRAFT_1518038 [Lyophyllum atratum]|nr:hypothetical protein FPV67DRAFT_1518038 [Lyophyllum atratum]